MATWDMDWRTGEASWSEMLFRALGYDPDPEGRATMEMWRSRIHPEDLPRVREAMERAKRDGSLYNPEHRILRADDGHVVWLRVFGRFLYDDSGEPSRFVGMVAVTDRDSDQAEASKSRLGTILRDAAEAVTVQDFEGRILAWSPAAEKRYGWSEAEALEMNIRSMVPESRRPELAEFAARLARGESVEPFDTQRITRNGRILDVRVAVAALVDVLGKAYAIATVELDITKHAVSAPAGGAG
jgi:PAS domain S-box-containing protein